MLFTSAGLAFAPKGTIVFVQGVTVGVSLATDIFIPLRCMVRLNAVKTGTGTPH